MKSDRKVEITKKRTSQQHEHFPRISHAFSTHSPRISTRFSHENHSKSTENTTGFERYVPHGVSNVPTETKGRPAMQSKKGKADTLFFILDNTTTDYFSAMP